MSNGDERFQPNVPPEAELVVSTLVLIFAVSTRKCSEGSTGTQLLLIIIFNCF